MLLAHFAIGQQERIPQQDIEDRRADPPAATDAREDEMRVWRFRKLWWVNVRTTFVGVKAYHEVTEVWRPLRHGTETMPTSCVNRLTPDEADELRETFYRKGR